jgi:hypothetical protein
VALFLEKNYDLEIPPLKGAGGMFKPNGFSEEKMAAFENLNLNK